MLINDANSEYGDKSFWMALIRDGREWLLPRVRFIVSADHAMDYPAEFQAWQGLAHPQWPSKAGVLGPANRWDASQNEQKPAYVGLLVGECNGLALAMRHYIDLVELMPTEKGLMEYLHSCECLKRMAQSFGSYHKPVRSWKLSSSVSYSRPKRYR